LEVLNALDEEGGLFEARHKGELRIVKKVKDKKIFEETIEFLKFVRPLVQLQFPQLVGYSIHGPGTQGSTAAWIACCHTDLVPLGAYLEAKKSDPLQHFIVTSIIAMDCQEALEFLHSNKLEWDPRQLGLQNLISESSGRMWIGFYDGDIKPAKKQDDLAFRMFRSDVRLHGAIQGVPTLSPKFYKEHVKKLKKEKSTLETLMLVKGLLFGRTLLWGFRRLRTVVPAGPSSLLTSSASSLLLLPTWYPKSIDDILFPLQKGDISQSFSLEIKMTIIQEKPMSSSTKTHDISHPFAATGTNFNQDTSAFLESCGIKPQIVHTENPQIKEYDLSLYLSSLSGEHQAKIFAIPISQGGISIEISLVLDCEHLEGRYLVNTGKSIAEDGSTYYGAPFAETLFLHGPAISKETGIPIPRIRIALLVSEHYYALFEAISGSETLIQGKEKDLVFFHLDREAIYQPLWKGLHYGFKFADLASIGHLSPFAECLDTCNRRCKEHPSNCHPCHQVCNGLKMHSGGDRSYNHHGFTPEEAEFVTWVHENLVENLDENNKIVFQPKVELENLLELLNTDHPDIVHMTHASANAIFTPSPLPVLDFIDKYINSVVQ